MRLGSTRNDDAGRTAAETETEQRQADSTAAAGGTAQPTFTPAARRPGDDMDGEMAGRDAAVPQPGDPVQQGAPAGGYGTGGGYRDASDYSTGGGHRDAGDAASSGEGGDQPVVRYAQVEQVDRAEPAGSYQPGQDAAPAPTPAPAGGAALNEPLLSGNTELLQRWQHVQAQFVEDPRVAVAGAADLVEQAGRALVDALEQRQRQMRGLWDRGGSAAPGDGVDTEQMRQLMQRYRALFNQLYRPA
ncbi:MAG TPA: hypothetical protein VHF26_05355 [Trebonia sp.]|nr:hypothetical protein [Trebonia sp.]